MTNENATWAILGAHERCWENIQVPLSSQKSQSIPSLRGKATFAHLTYVLEAALSLHKIYLVYFPPKNKQKKQNTTHQGCIMISPENVKMKSKQRTTKQVTDEKGKVWRKTLLLLTKFDCLLRHFIQITKYMKKRCWMEKAGSEG